LEGKEEERKNRQQEETIIRRIKRVKDTEEIIRATNEILREK